jgi:hypothetical protein
MALLSLILKGGRLFSAKQHSTGNEALTCQLFCDLKPLRGTSEILPLREPAKNDEEPAKNDERDAEEEGKPVFIVDRVGGGRKWKNDGMFLSHIIKR